MDNLLHVQAKELINRFIKSHYVPEYQNSIPDAEALGKLLAFYFRWDGAQIMDAFQSALEDANFHSINEQITNLREVENV